MLCNVCSNEEVRAEAVRRFHLLMKDDDRRRGISRRNVEELCHTEIRQLCMREGVKEGEEVAVSRTVNQLMEKYQETTGAEKRRILAAVGQAQFKPIVMRILSFSLDGTVRKQDTYTVFASVMRNKKFHKCCWEYLRQNLGNLAESLKGSFNMLGYFVEAGGSVLDEPAELAEFQEFMARPENNIKQVSRSISIAEQNIKMNIVKKEYFTKSIKEYFMLRVCLQTVGINERLTPSLSSPSSPSASSPFAGPSAP